ncbi:uncharacterized protein LOC112515906 isoform X2 [Cynara cardunculus var. scolymus]|uniref:Uncharacterized protein n=1 Tax=Cynara cardunculus var. scolymus TaxID=59895 RepID=A0A118JVI8_CYNCS|nr:uncharacterized protein LOC112515906 isoform X2 [Cynara cardunculus var. scolymus]KVH92832.1 hypothetical protein Ccrd_005151 [Cynara cardunculus var. scolymus]
MAQTIGFIRLIRVRTTTSIASVLPPPRIPLSGKFEPFKSLTRGFESPAGRYTRPLILDWKLCVRRYFHMTKSYNLGHEFSMGRLLGVSAVLGSFLLRPRFAHCMDGYASSADDHSMGMLGKSETDDNPHSFMIFAKKLMVPIALLLIVWMNWNYPVVLGVKVILTLLSTKPSPFSVYVFIEQLQQQYRGQHPFLHKFKSSYAKKVEVEDYTVFCIAKIEMGDQKYTLLGILGGWWVFELTSLRSALSGFRSRTLEILETAVSSDV